MFIDVVRYGGFHSGGVRCLDVAIELFLANEVTHP